MYQIRNEVDALSNEVKPLSNEVNPLRWKLLLKGYSHQQQQIYDELTFIRNCTVFWAGHVRSKIDNSRIIQIFNDWIQDIKKAIQLLKNNKSESEVWVNEMWPILLKHKENMWILQNDTLKLLITSNKNGQLRKEVSELEVEVDKMVKDVSSQCSRTKLALHTTKTKIQSQTYHIRREIDSEKKKIDQMQMNLNNIKIQMEKDINERNTLLEQQTKQIKGNIESNLEANKNIFKKSFEKKVEIFYTFQGFDERNILTKDFYHTIRNCSTLKSASPFIYNRYMPMGEYAPTFGPNSLLIHFVHATEFAEDRDWGDLVQKTASNFLYFKARYVVVLVAREMSELDVRDISAIHSGIDEYWKVFKILTPMNVRELMYVYEEWKDRLPFINEFEDLCGDFAKYLLVKN